ncbi:MAG: hypothetical protein HYY26_03200, partial [Acidobacteria bacterium]|nr:hypothetical protein [Acidobacteriota bacterium]
APGAGLWTLTALTALLAVLITETTSNTATASMVVPVSIAVAESRVTSH